MIELLRREFVVQAPVEEAWTKLACVEDWPVWAQHIRRVTGSPRGPLGPDSAGNLHLSNGIRVTFRMSQFNPPQNWAWVGAFLWLTVRYDHRFEPIDASATRLTWIVEAEGRLVRVIGPLFARLYARNLDRAIQMLISNLKARGD